MGVFTRKYLDAWCGPITGGANDSCTAAARPRKSIFNWCFCVLILCGASAVTAADTYRIATFAAPLSRDGPGLLLRDITKDKDDQIAAIAAVIKRISPDVLVLTDFDYDMDGYALAAFAGLLDLGYHNNFAARPNTGVSTGLDMDANGHLGDARDAQGYGRFNGDGGMAILSRFPIDSDRVVDLSDVLWQDLPGATLPMQNGKPFLSDAVRSVQRLSTAGHWIVPVIPPDGASFSVMAYAATPPVFDGPEDRNGLRNRDELRLWETVLSGGYGPVPDWFVIAGNANLDPVDGQGDRAAMAAFLANPRLQDPLPGLDTADWDDNGPGNLRVSYVLPSSDWQIKDAGVFWPSMTDPYTELLGDDGMAAGAHHLVWVDITR